MWVTIFTCSTRKKPTRRLKDKNVNIQQWPAIIYKVEHIWMIRKLNQWLVWPSMNMNTQERGGKGLWLTWKRTTITHELKLVAAYRCNLPNFSDTENTMHKNTQERGRETDKMKDGYHTTSWTMLQNADIWNFSELSTLIAMSALVHEANVTLFHLYCMPLLCTNAQEHHSQL